MIARGSVTKRKDKRDDILTIDIVLHGSYNLEKVLKFTSRLEKSLNSVKVLEKNLGSLLGLEKSLKFTTLSTPDTIFRKTRLFCRGKFGSSSVRLRTCKTHV